MNPTNNSWSIPSLTVKTGTLACATKPLFRAEYDETDETLLTPVPEIRFTISD